MQFTSNTESLPGKLISVLAITGAMARQTTARKIFLAENTTLKLNAYNNSNYRYIWKHPINDKGEEYAEYHYLMPHLRADSAKFKEYLTTFDHLLMLIEDDLTKITINYKKPISPEERLVITIRLVKPNLFSYIIYYYNNVCLYIIIMYIYYYNNVCFQVYPLR